MESVADQIYDGITLATIDLDRFSESLKNDIIVFLKQAQEEIIKTIIEYNIGEVVIQKYKNDRLLKINKQISKILDNTYNTIEKYTEKQLVGMAGYESENIIKILNAPIKANVFEVTLTQDNLEAIVKNSNIEGKTISEWWVKKSADYQDKVKAAMTDIKIKIQQGIITGDSVIEMSRRIKGTSEERGLIEEMGINAEAHVRTSVMTVANQVREKLYEGNADIIKGYQFVATLDLRTTQICRSLNGREWDMNHNPINGNSRPWPGFPPLHWRCRSTIIPILKSFKELVEEKRLRDADENVIKTMGTPANANKKYEDWLEGLDLAKQKQVLGKARLEAWKAGKLTEADLISQKGRALSLEALKKREGSK